MNESNAAPVQVAERTTRADGSLAVVLAVLLNSTRNPAPIGPERQITAKSSKTLSQESQMAAAMAQASRALMPQITKMSELQLDSYSQMKVSAELVPFFSQLKDLEPEQRESLKVNLKELFAGCVDRWGDLNFDDAQSKPDRNTGSTPRDRALLPIEAKFVSSVEYADARAQIQEIFNNEKVENSTPIVKKTALAIVREARDKKGLNVYHEGELKRWIEEETVDPRDIEAARLAQEAHDKAKLEALTDAMNARLKLTRGARPTALIEQDVRRQTGKPLSEVIERLGEFMPGARVKNKP